MYSSSSKKSDYMRNVRVSLFHIAILMPCGKCCKNRNYRRICKYKMW